MSSTTPVGFRDDDVVAVVVFVSLLGSLAFGDSISKVVCVYRLCFYYGHLTVLVCWFSDVAMKPSCCVVVSTTVFAY